MEADLLQLAAVLLAHPLNPPSPPAHVLLLLHLAHAWITVTTFILEIII